MNEKLRHKNSDSMLAGKTIIVTGAGRGIGKAIAHAVAARGMRVALLARTEKEITQEADVIRDGGGEALPLACDVSDPAQVTAAVAQCKAKFGVIDALVNNAGAFLEAPIPEIKLEDWDYVFRVNVTGPLLFMQSLLPIMTEQGGGKIINIASTAGLQAYLHQSAYCASKHALLGLSRCLALEAKPHNVHVHSICPGGVRTGFIAKTNLGQRLEGQVIIEPEDVAETVVFLLGQPDNIDIPEIVMRRCQP